MKAQLAVGLALAAGFAMAAEASTVRFKFSGTIDQLSGIQGPVQLNDSFTVAYEFDSTTPDTDPAPNFGMYTGAINLVEGEVGSYIVNNNAGDISVLNNGFAGDTYHVNILSANGSVTFSLGDFQGGAFQNDHLPITLILDDWELKRFTIHVDIGPTFWEASGVITAFSSVIECYPDCNNSGNLTIADFGCFQAAFASGNPYADCNNSGNLTIADFGCFQASFAAGCP